MRLHLLTRFEHSNVRKTEDIADLKISDKWTDGNYSLFPEQLGQ